MFSNRSVLGFSIATAYVKLIRRHYHSMHPCEYSQLSVSEEEAANQDAGGSSSSSDMRSKGPGIVKRTAEENQMLMREQYKHEEKLQRIIQSKCIVLHLPDAATALNQEPRLSKYPLLPYLPMFYSTIGKYRTYIYTKVSNN